MINPKNKLFRWGPIDGLPIYSDFWFAGMKGFKKTYSPGWPEAFNYFRDSKFTCVIDNKKLNDVGEEIFKRHILPGKKLQQNYQAWLDFLQDYSKYIEKIKKTKLSKNNILEILDDWIEINGKEFWNIGSLPEVANWGGEQLLKRELKKNLKSVVDFQLSFAKLAAPEKLSFYQVEELELLKFKKVSGQKLEQELIKHQQNFFWLMNSYDGSRRLPVSYFRSRLKKETVQTATKKIIEMEKHLRDAVACKEKIVKKYRLSKELLKISRALAYSIWWQDNRKAYIFQGIHITNLLLKAITKICKVKLHDLYFYNLPELKELVETGIALSGQELRLRRSGFLAGWDGENSYYISGQMANDLFEPFIEKITTEGITEFKGLVVNRGVISGRVKIIHSPKEIAKMKKGNILVASMTSPDYIMALKKASAVVTDVGGMTCHAAIVSRELKIPCIVATKIATKVLKDGDIVEVDANRGIIRKI